MGKLIKNIKVPTGNICVMEADKGKLEFLSIGDYGKDLNIKPDFLGITRPLNGVPNGEIMSLTETQVKQIRYMASCNPTFDNLARIASLSDESVLAEWEQFKTDRTALLQGQKDLLQFQIDEINNQIDLLNE